MDSAIVIASKSALERVKGIPELLSIDREIGRPHIAHPPMFNSQAWSRKIELPWVIEHIGPIEDQTILDIGSGSSALPIYLGRHGADVTSVDLEVPIGLPDNQVKRVKSAIPRLPFHSASFDIVICVSVLEHVSADIPQCFAEICRLARGRVILTFDFAMEPFSPHGLSSIELRAFGRMLRTKIDFPEDPLLPPASELGIWAGQLGVCMLFLDRPEDGWPSLPIGGWQRLLIRFYRFAQNRIFIHKQLPLRLRSSIALRRRHR